VAVAADTSLIDQRIREIRNLKNPVFMCEALKKVKRFVKTRIFLQGLDSTGSPIGQYAPTYIIKRARKGLGTSSRVVLRFTFNMMADFQVICEGDEVGYGFQSQRNISLSNELELKYGKPIWSLTEEEKARIVIWYGKIVERNFK